MTSSSESNETSGGEALMDEVNPQAESPSTSATTDDIPSFGWSAYAERVNGRFAMIGLTAVLLIEAVSGNTFLHWAGFFH